MTDMTKAEVLAIWKGLVKHMTDQGAVVPFAHEIASRVRNELLARIEAAEKSDAESIAMYRKVRDERDALRKELIAAHKMAMNGAEWRDLAKKYAARIEEMERKEAKPCP